MPFLNGSHPGRKNIACDDGYVSVAGLLNHDDIKAENIAMDELTPLDLAQFGEHGNDQFVRNIKFRHGLNLIIYDGIL